MKIAHIFNETPGKKQEFIEAQEFDVDYITNYHKKYELPVKYDTDFEKLYFEALYPIEDKSIISKYDEDKLNNLLEKLGDDILMISGDFWGIQKFIFENLTSKNAAKILRSRSAMVQLITFVVVDLIKKEFLNSDKVLFGAGKFLILAKKENNYQEKLENIQKKLDEYFIKNFFGENGFILSYQETTKDKILNQDSNEMKDDLIQLGKNNELNKLNKFKLVENEYVIDVFDEAKSDDDICKFCKTRAGVTKIKDEKACDICANQIKLGEKLTKNRYMKIYTSTNKTDDILIFSVDDVKYYAKFYNSEREIFDCKLEAIENVFDISNEKYQDFAKWAISSFVAKEDNKVKSFEDLESKGLMALKADVDRLGKTFRDYYMTSFKKFNRLSRELDFFFSNYVPYFIENSKYKDSLYIIFAGGDDLFLVGEYEAVVEFAKEIRDIFYKWSLEKATLSMGLVMFKHSTPISYIASLADEAEARAKNVNNGSRDGIDIFGVTMKFDEFKDIEKRWSKIVEKLDKKNKETTSFYYRLLEITQMREELKKDKFDPTNGMWKSKIAYIFKRNLKLEDEFYKDLVDLVEEYGIKLKPSIFLTIYKRRK